MMQLDLPKCPHCGMAIDAGRRSKEEHDFLFAVIRAAHYHWPEESTFLGDNPEHLRAFLLCKAGWRDSEFIENSDDPKANERLADILDIQFRRERKKGIYVFITMAPGGVHVHRPRSINKRDMKRKEFQEYATRVYEYIQAEIGVPVDELLRESEVAA